MNKTIVAWLFALCIAFVNVEAKPNFNDKDLFQTNCLIDNKGQFDLPQSSSSIEFGYIHQGQELYFSKGNIFFPYAEKGITNFIRLEWLGTSPDCKMIKEQKSSHYFSFGAEKQACYGWQKIVYKNLYPGVDLVFETSETKGIKYTLLAENEKSLQQVKYRYQGSESLHIKPEPHELLIASNSLTIHEKELTVYTEDGIKHELQYVLTPDQTIRFANVNSEDKPKGKLIVDPYITTTTTLSGVTASVSNMGYDVDYDAQGNLFVLGGGGGVNSATSAPKIAKYDINGNLIWTFVGTLASPIWNTSPQSFNGQSTGCVGNFVVDKISGKIYVGQGYSSSGSRVIRLNSNGLYDAFISTANNQVQEIWDMKFNCSNGRVIAMGGSINSNLNFGVVDTTSGVVSTSCVTGVGSFRQDIVCATLDLSGEVYLIFASNTSTILDNKIYKLSANYGSVIWNTPSGYFTFSEDENKPYSGLGAFSNGYNALAVNTNYLFYYDGVNIKAFDKLSGSSVGSPIQVLNQSPKMQGGIYANDCNEVFVGGNNGMIFRYGFNGSNFTLQDTILLPGQQGHAVFDITSNPVNNLLYVSGDKFVSTTDQESTCPLSPSGNLNLSYSIACPDSAYVTITNADPSISYTFYWTDSTTNTPIQTNIAPPGVSKIGIAGLTTGHTYKVTVLKPSPCQIISNTISFIFSCGVMDVTVCPGQTYTLSNNTILSTPGLYMDTVLNSIGQDSIIYINFSNYPTYLDTVYASICDTNSYTLPNGTSVNVAGIFPSNLSTVNGCDSIIVTVLSKKNSTSFTQTSSICSDQSFTLPNNQVVNSAGTYVTTIPNHVNCDSVITTILTVTPKPTNFLGNDTTLCNNGFFEIDASMSGATYLWNDNSIFPKRTISEKGVYILQITLPPCAPALDTQLVFACACNVFVPNAFTPNGDGKNDLFKPTFNCITPPENYSLHIYNRWGNMIFYTKLQDDGWDGTYLGSKEDGGTYFYYIKYIDPNTGKESNFNGDVTLMR